MVQRDRRPAGRPRNAQLCLTNEDMRRELVRNLKERLRAHPEATIASVSQNDCFGPCTCPNCRAVDEEEGGPAGSLLRFVNAVAAEIEPEFPGRGHRHPGLPVHSEAAPARPAADRMSSSASAASSARSPSLSTIRATRPSSTISTVGRRSPAASISGTTRANFSHYIQPHPNYGVLAPNIRLFVRHNVRGRLRTGRLPVLGVRDGRAEGLDTGQALWDPRLDEEKLRGRVLAGLLWPGGRRHGGATSKGSKRPWRKPAMPWAAIPRPTPNSCPSRRWPRSLRSSLRPLAGKPAVRRNTAAVSSGPALPVAYAVITSWDAFRDEARRTGTRWPWAETAGRAPGPGSWMRPGRRTLL